jgi:hypothetical protein
MFYWLHNFDIIKLYIAPKSKYFQATDFNKRHNAALTNIWSNVLSRVTMEDIDISVCVTFLDLQIEIIFFLIKLLTTFGSSAILEQQG